MRVWKFAGVAKSDKSAHSRDSDEENEFLISRDPPVVRSLKKAKSRFSVLLVIIVSVVNVSILFFSLINFRQANSVCGNRTHSLYQNDMLNRLIKLSSTYSPVFDEVNMERNYVTFNGALVDNTSIWRQPPSPEVDAAWDYISTDGYEAIVASSLDVSRSGKNVSMSVKVPASWNLGDDAYLAQIEVFHQIHCLNQLRKEVYSSHYFNSRPNELRINHRNHCIHIILQVLMCNADVGLIFHNWVHNEKLPDPKTRPFADFSTVKQCRNFDNILDWAGKKGVRNVKEKMRDLAYPPGTPFLSGDSYAITPSVGGRHTV